MNSKWYDFILQVLFEKLNCENEEEEADCLVDLPTPEDLVKAVPYEWSSARQRKLPEQGESQLGHSWVIIDKHILKESPYTYWKDNKLSNNVPIVFGTHKTFVEKVRECFDGICLVSP